MNFSQDAKLKKITEISKNEYIFEFESDNNFYVWDRNTGIDKYNPNMHLINMEPCHYHVSIVDIINNYINCQN